MGWQGQERTFAGAAGSLWASGEGKLELTKAPRSHDRGRGNSRRIPLRTAVVGCRERRGSERACHTGRPGLVPLWFGASMLVSNLILVEHLGHVVSDRIPIVGHRHEGDLFAGFRVLVAGLRFGSLGLLGVLRSAHSHQYTSITPR